jgi:hypothetical protein
VSDTYTPPLSTVSGKDYLEVKHRVYWVRQEHKDAQIVTDLISHDAEHGYAVVKAIVTLPSTGAVGTGYGMAERGGPGPAAKRYIEFAETRAIGRACAAVGYGTLAALEEDSDPADAPAPKSAPGRAVVAATTPQRSESAPNTPAPLAVVLDAEVVAAGTAFRAAAATAGYSTKEAQDKYAKEQYPGRGLSTLTADEWRALELRCRAMYSDVPEEAPIF